MRKFFTDNIAWIIIVLMAVAVAALVLAIMNKKQLSLPAENANNGGSNDATGNDNDTAEEPRPSVTPIQTI